jgi:hypothetical protein
VVQIAEVFVESVVGRQHVVAITQVVLAELAGFVSQRLECVGDGRCLHGKAQQKSRLPDGRQSGADG